MLLMGKGKILGLLAGLMLLQGGMLHVAKQPEPDREPIKWAAGEVGSENIENAGEADSENIENAGEVDSESIENTEEPDTESIEDAEAMDTGSWMREEYERLGEEEAAAAASLEEQDAAGAGTETSDLSGELRNIRTQKMVLKARMEEAGVSREP